MLHGNKTLRMILGRQRINIDMASAWPNQKMSALNRLTYFFWDVDPIFRMYCSKEIEIHKCITALRKRNDINDWRGFSNANGTV